MAPHCPFCNAGDRYIAESGTAAALWDHYPVNPGHALIIPKAHRRNLFECTDQERADMWQVLLLVRQIVQQQHRPAGFNIGTNVEPCAGQTVFHCHVHLIPRFEGDAAQPRGGVRRVKPPLVPYTVEGEHHNPFSSRKEP